MQDHEFHWSLKDGKKVYAREWMTAAPKGVICIVHGLGEHCNRYNHVAKFFNENDFALMGVDLAGHGRTEGKKCHVEGLDVFLEQVETLLSKASEKYPGLPILLYGHSMGGNIVLNYVLRRKPKIRGLIVSGPWIQTTEKPPALLIFIGRILNWVSPGLVLSNNLNVPKISKDPEVVQAYIDDPYVYRGISARMASEMLDAANWLDKYEGEMPIPTLIMHGSEDGLTSPKASLDFSKRVEGIVVHKMWEGLYHEIHNEKEQNEVFDYTLNWIKNLIKT